MKILINRKQIVLLFTLIPVNMILCHILCTYGVEGVGVIYQLVSFNLFIYLIYIGLGENTFFNPYFAFAVCPLSLAFYMPNASRYYMADLNSKTYVLLVFNFIAFTLGLVFFKNINLIKARNKSKRWPKVNNPDINRRWAVAFVWISLLPVLLAIILGISGGWNNIKNAYEKIPLSGITNMLVFAGLVFAFKSRKKKTIIFSVLAVVITAVALLTKTSVMFAIVIIIGSFDKYYNTKKFKKWQYILLFVAIILFALADSTYTEIRGAQLHVHAMIERASGGILPPWALSSYLYLEMPWSNTQYVMQNDISSTNGLWVMKTFLGYLGLDSNYAQFYELQHPTSFNTFGYVIYFFKDFGFIGSLIASYILGVIINKLYAAYQTSTSPFLAVVYLFNFRAVMMMFFNNHWCTGAYPITIAVLMLISTIVYKSVPFMGEIPEKREELY